MLCLGSNPVVFNINQVVLVPTFFLNHNHKGASHTNNSSVLESLTNSVFLMTGMTDLKMTPLVVSKINDKGCIVDIDEPVLTFEDERGGVIRGT